RDLTQFMQAVRHFAIEQTFMDLAGKALQQVLHGFVGHRPLHDVLQEILELRITGNAAQPNVMFHNGFGLLLAGAKADRGIVVGLGLELVGIENDPVAVEYQRAVALQVHAALRTALPEIRCSWRHGGAQVLRALAARASSVIRPQSLAATASAGVSHVPPQTGTFGSARNCGALSTVMPPVGQNLTSVKTPAKDFSRLRPPTATAGNSLRNW